MVSTLSISFVLPARGFALLLVLAAAVLLGCGDDAATSCEADCPAAFCQADGACSALRCDAPGSCPVDQYCDTTLSRCLPGCETKDPCDGGFVCDPQTHQCVGCDDDKNLKCLPIVGVCNEKSGRCVQCVSDLDCDIGETGAFCQPTLNTCVPGCVRSLNCPVSLTCATSPRRSAWSALKTLTARASATRAAAWSVSKTQAAASAAKNTATPTSKPASLVASKTFLVLRARPATPPAACASKNHNRSPTALGEPLKMRATLSAALLQRIPKAAFNQAPDLSIRPPLAPNLSDASSDETLAPADTTHVSARPPSSANGFVSSSSALIDNTWLPRLSIDERLLATELASEDALAVMSLASDFREVRDVSDLEPPPPDSRTPCDFEVINELGRGGMGVVQRARQRTLRREVALKRARTLGNSANALLHEAQIAGALEHPHIVPIHALGLDQHNQPVLVMKCVEGIVWRTLIHEPDHIWWSHVGLPSDQLHWHIERLIQVCDAIAFAHGRGVLHRDLKPDNVMIGAFGELYVLDWGVALDLTAPDPPPNTPDAHSLPSSRYALVGTPAYMPPEMINAEPPVGVQTDIYLLGAILHEILTKNPPHYGDSIFAVLHHASDPPPLTLPDTHPELASICVRALRPHPPDRYAHVSDLKAALRSYLQHRAAHKLIDQAAAHLPALQDLCASASQNLSPQNLSKIQRLFIEARFALTQALQDLPQDPTALATLTQILSLMIHTELALGNISSARALLSDLPAPDPALLALIEEQERAASQKDAELSNLQAMAHHLDARVATRQRATLTLILALFWAALVAFAVIAHRVLGYNPTYTEALGAAFGGLIMALGGMFALRNAFQFHKLNREVMAIFATTVAFATLFRTLGWHLSLPVLTTLNLELLPISLAALVGAIVLDRRIIPPALLCLSCGLLGVLFPAISPESYLLGQFGSLLWIAWIWYRAPTKPPSPPTLPSSP